MNRNQAVETFSLADYHGAKENEDGTLTMTVEQMSNLIEYVRVRETKVIQAGAFDSTFHVREFLHSLNKFKDEGIVRVGPLVLQEIPMLVGNEYYTYAGELVKMVEAKGPPPYETIMDNQGRHRYNRPDDRGRCTGSTNSPDSIPTHYRIIQSDVSLPR